MNSLSKKLRSDELNNSANPVVVWKLPLRSLDAVNARVKELSRLNSFRSLTAIALEWGFLFGMVALAHYLDNFLLSVPIIVCIAARQHALAILMHDASHYRLLPSRRWNDIISNFFLAYPLLITTEGYRRSHLEHHAHLNTDKDPDWTRKRGLKDWSFPKTGLELGSLFLKVFSGAGFFHLTSRAAVYSKRSTEKDAKGTALLKTAIRLTYYILTSYLVLKLVGGMTILTYWFLPLFTFLPVFLRVRSIAEHFGMQWTSDLNMSRTVLATPFERFLFAPHSIHFHLEHHLFPSVPFYNLRELHQVLVKNSDYATHAHITRGYVWGGSSLLKELTRNANNGDSREIYNASHEKNRRVER